MKHNGDNATLALPGFFELVQDGVSGEARVRITSMPDWLTVREACEFAQCGEDLVRGRVEDGTLTHRWKDHVGERGTLLIHGGSLKMWIDQRVHIGRLHPQLDLAAPAK